MYNIISIEVSVLLIILSLNYFSSYKKGTTKKKSAWILLISICTIEIIAIITIMMLISQNKSIVGSNIIWHYTVPILMCYILRNNSRDEE